MCLLILTDNFSELTWFITKRTTIEKVKEAMFTEVDTDNTINPVFVYATDEALNEQPLPLSSALQVCFVAP